MIVSKSPLRVSFVGGGSDIPSYYLQNGGGAVLSTSIDKYVYVAVNRKFEKGIRLSYSITEELDSVKKISHPIVRNTIELLNIDPQIEITSMADIPSKGSGLGSSSSFTVALLHALYAYQNKHISSFELGELASHVEINLCKEPIGKQDQFASAFGGLNLIEFNEDSSVKIEPIICEKKTLKELKDSLIIFYTGRSHNASRILQEQSENLKSKSKRALMREMVKIVYEMKDLINKNDIENFGELMHKNWKLKCQMASNISDSEIDNWYQSGINAGATGGKILGAGNGGFIMFFARKERHKDIIKAMKGLKHFPFDFEKNGSQIIFYQPTTNFMD